MPIRKIAFVLLFFVPQSQSMAAPKNINLCNDKLKGVPWVWTAPKRIPSQNGKSELHFSNTHELEDLSPTLKELSSKPWREIYTKPISVFVDPSPILSERPILEIRSVDIDELVTYHETFFKSVDKIVKDQTSQPLLQGVLDHAAIKLTNQDLEPAFYTQIDYTSSFMSGRPNELLLKLEIKNKKSVTVLSLLEPTSEEERSFLLEKLSGDSDYWKNFVKAHEKLNAYDYDLYQSAVIKVLREKYKISIDLMLYLKAFLKKLMNVGEPQMWTYAWPIFYNRELLSGAKVDQVSYLPIYAPISREFLDAILAHPILEKTMDRWSQSGPYFKVMTALNIPGNDFWADYFPKMRNYLIGPGIKILNQFFIKNPEPTVEQLDKRIEEILEDYGPVLEISHHDGNKSS